MRFAHHARHVEGAVIPKEKRDAHRGSRHVHQDPQAGVHASVMLGTFLNGELIETGACALLRD
jgi:hypothetical protein